MTKPQTDEDDQNLLGKTDRHLQHDLSHIAQDQTPPPQTDPIPELPDETPPSSDNPSPSKGLKKVTSPQTEQTPEREQIRKIWRPLYDMGTKGSEQIDAHGMAMLVSQAVTETQAILTAVDAYVAGVIGEDEEVNPNQPLKCQLEVDGENTLRADQRRRAGIGGES